MDGLVRPGQPSPLQEEFESPVDVHAVAHPGHAQIDVILLGQGGQMGAIDLVVQELCSVLSKLCPWGPEKCGPRVGSPPCGSGTCCMKGNGSGRPWSERCFFSGPTLF